MSGPPPPPPPRSSWGGQPPSVRIHGHEHQGGGDASLCPPPPPMYGYNVNVAVRSSGVSHPPHFGHSPPNPRGPPSMDEPTAKRPRISEGTQHTCKICQVSMESASALQAHIQAHIACPQCDFEGSKKVVKAHFESVHGRFAGRGFKTVSIAVPGCPLQRFRICVGNHPDDVKKWIDDRKRKFPRRPAAAPAAQKESQEPKEQKPLGSLLAGYGSSSSDDDDDSVVPEDATAASKVGAKGKSEDPPTTGNAWMIPSANNYRTRPCRFFLQSGSCRNGDSCKFRHDDVEVKLSPARHYKRTTAHTKGGRLVPSSATLLRKLLQNDARRERILTLQLLRYICDCNFLQQQRRVKDPPNPE